MSPEKNKKKKEKKAPLLLQVPADLRRQFRVACVCNGQTMTDVLSRYMVQYKTKLMKSVVE